MLNVLRHKGVAKKVLWAVTVIIILSFAIFGTAYRLDNQLNSAGSLYGKSVAYRDFQKAYLDARDQSILIYGDQFFKNGQNLDLETQTWDRLILMQEVKKQNIKVSDQEVVDFIAQVPFFQRQGQFDASIYQSIVKSREIFNRNTRDFEEGVRQNIAMRKLFENLTAGSAVSEDELKKEYTLRHQKLTLDYVVFSPSAFTKDIKPNDDDIAAFYAKHKDGFRQPVMIKVDYVHIIVDEKATEEQKNTAKKNIFNLSAQLTAKADFATEAKKLGLEVKTSDYFSLEQPLLTFASNPEETEKMFALKTGEFTKPLSVPDGWQIVRINDKKESRVPELAEIKDQVKEAFISDAAYTRAKTKANEDLAKFLEAVKASDFKSAAKQFNLPLTQTPSFSRGEYVANVGLVSELQADAAKLTPENPTSGLILTSQGPVITHLAKQEAVDDKEYEQGKEEFRQMLEAQRRQQKIGTFMNQLRLTADVKSKMKKQ